jgi:hypothetical protein
MLVSSHFSWFVASLVVVELSPPESHEPSQAPDVEDQLIPSARPAAMTLPQFFLRPIR